MRAARALVCVWCRILKWWVSTANRSAFAVPALQTGSQVLPVQDNIRELFFLWCYLCFVLLRFRLYASVEAAALRPIVLRYAGVPIATRVSLFLFFSCCLFGDVVFFFVRRVRRTFFPSGWYFFYLVITGWIFDIGLCENSINQSIHARET